MRRLPIMLTLACALACAAAAGAAQAALTAATLGRAEPLSVEASRGLVVLSGGGIVVGRVAEGSILVRIPPAARSGAEVTVFGHTPTVAGADRIYQGRDVRFRIVSDQFWLEAGGTDVSLSVLAGAFVASKGAGTLDTLDGPARRIENHWTMLRLGVPALRDSRPTRRSLLRAEIRWMRNEGMSWPRVMATPAWREFVRLSPG